MATTSSYPLDEGDSLDENSFDLLRLQRETFVNSVEHFESTTSTNDIALSRAADRSLLTPHLVLASLQTSGRGRGANSWWSSPGGLTFSLVVEPEPSRLPPRQWPLLSLMTGLAVSEALGRAAPALNFQLKWPNDVYCQGRKICGILIESNAARGRLIVGVGVNVNNSPESAAELTGKAVSLAGAAQRTFNLTSILIDTLNQWELWMSRLAADRSAALDCWREKCFLTGRQVMVDAPNAGVAGTCLGVDDEGALVVQDKHETRRCMAGVVTSWS